MESLSSYIKFLKLSYYIATIHLYYLPCNSLKLLSLDQLSDFGLAVTDGTQNKNNIKLSGTLGYVAPEYLLDGMPTRTVVIAHCYAVYKYILLKNFSSLKLNIMIILLDL